MNSKALILKSGETRDATLSYKMTNEPVGYCLIINNMEYSDMKSLYDIRYIRNFFESVRFIVTVTEHLTVEEFESCIEKFGSKDFKIVDSMILIVLSRGNYSDVCSVDGKYISKKKIYDYFNINMPDLKNKPKGFFFISFGNVIQYEAESLKSCSTQMYPRCDTFVYHIHFVYELQGLACHLLTSLLHKHYLTLDIETIMDIFQKEIKGRMFLGRVVQSSKRFMLCRNH